MRDSDLLPPGLPPLQTSWLRLLESFSSKGTLTYPKKDPGLVAAMYEYKELLVNVGLLNRTSSLCSPNVMSRWSCDRCTEENRPQEFFTVYGASGGVEDANALTCMRFGSTWYIVVWGSHDAANWMSDVDTSLVELPQSWASALRPHTQPRAREGKSGDGVGRCHRGFLEVWQSLEPGLLRELATRGVHPKSTDAVLLLGGHSMGAAGCTLGAISLWAKDYNLLGNVNFESPLVLDSDAADAYEAVLGLRTLRVTNMNDPVPHLPFYPASYTHVGSELYMRDGSASLCTFSAVKRCRAGTGEADDCVCSSRDRSALLFPAQHCRTKHYLSFDFCECNDSSMKVSRFTLFQYLLWCMFLGGALFVLLAGGRWLRSQAASHQFGYSRR